MARRSKEEITAEIRRAYAATRIFAEIRAEDSPEEADLLECLPDIDDWIAGCLAQGGTLSQVLAGVMENVNGDLVHFRTARQPDEIARNRNLLSRYRERTGLDFLAQFADPVKTAKAVLRRGEILHETDYRIVMEILNDTGQTVFDGTRIARLNAAVAAFEAAYDSAD